MNKRDTEDPTLRGHRRFHSHVLGKQHIMAASEGIGHELYNIKVSEKSHH